MSKISDIIKQLRSAPLSLSQTEIASLAGMSQTKISRWENGEVSAGAEDALKLVSLLEKKLSGADKAAA